jgi:hypothetical protein
VGLVPTGHRTRRCHGAERAERLMCESWVLPRQNSLKRKLVTGDNSSRCLRRINVDPY